MGTDSIKWKSWLLVLAVFAAGALFGAIVAGTLTRNFIRNAMNNPEVMRQLVEKRLDSKLDLDEAQQARVHEIVIESQKEIQILRAEVQPRFLDILDRGEARIMEVLDEEQQEKFQKMKQEREKIWKRD